MVEAAKLRIAISLPTIELAEDMIDLIDILAHYPVTLSMFK
jgi:hypothetical protein